MPSWFIACEKEALMLKFKFDYQANILAYQEPFGQAWQEVEDKFEGNFGSQGFRLPTGWINFTIYESKIRVFYKQASPNLDTSDFWTPAAVTYYRKDLPKQAPVIFTFTEADQVEKVGKSWVKKGEKSL